MDRAEGLGTGLLTGLRVTTGLWTGLRGWVEGYGQG